MEELKKVGLDKMPALWYEQAQLVLWPKDTPMDPFQHFFQHAQMASQRKFL